MATLFLDLSSGSVLFLVMAKYRLMDLQELDQASPQEDLGAILHRIRTQTDQPIDQVHLILPDRVVHTELAKLQMMPLADAEKVIARQRGAEADALVRLTEVAGPSHHLHCIQEIVSRAEIERWQRIFTAEKIRLATVTTLLQALLAAFAPLRAEMNNVEVVFSLGARSLTALFLSRDAILHHAHIPLQDHDQRPEEQDDQVRWQKRRQFAVLTPLHSIFSAFMRDHSDLQVDKIWLCGPFQGIEGVAESLTEATGLKVMLANHIADFDENSCAFTALAGLLRTHDDPARFNLLPKDMRKTAMLRPKFLLVAVSCLLAVALAGLVALTETRLTALNQDLEQARVELSAAELALQNLRPLAADLDFLEGLDAGAAPFYEIFRDLANRLPVPLGLRRLEFREDSLGGTLQLAIVAPFNTVTERNFLFSALIEALEGSEYLADYDEPSVEVLGAGPEQAKMVLITIACRVAAGQEGPP